MLNVLLVRPGAYHRLDHLKGASLGWASALLTIIRQTRGRIFSRVRPFYERAVSDLDLSRSLTTRSPKGRT
jgi:hypothetical protein